MALARTGDDSWGITESVGATALGVAMARAAESACSSPLFIDRYAQLFVDAAVERGWDSTDAAKHLPLVQKYAAARTKWFDEYFIAAGANGIDQAVILASGLDARAWRLPWVSRSTVYEIDQPEVLAFKAEILDAHRARPKRGYRAVPIDLRADWPTALQEAGFDPSTPTAWSAEGLLPYLPPAAQDLMFERVLKLSAPGSRIAAEALHPSSFDADYIQRGREHLGDTGPDPTDLLFADERADIRQWLTDRDWSISEIEGMDLMRRFDRMPEEALADIAPRSVFVEGRLQTVRPLRYCES